MATSAWSTPKVDWDQDDVLADSDFNRIEDNTQALYTERYIAGTYMGSTLGNIGPQDTESLSEIGLLIPDDHQVWIRRVQFNLTDGNAQLKVTGTDDQALVWNDYLVDDVWSGTADLAVDFLLTVNISGSAANASIHIDVFNAEPLFGSDVVLDDTLAWALKIYMKEVP